MSPRVFPAEECFLGGSWWRTETPRRASLSLLKQMEEELQTASGDEEDVLRSEAERLDALAAVAEGLAGFRGDHVEVAIELQNRLRSTAGDLRERATEY